ncbi:HDOD domain-containing protein [Proteinivorax tanatarense]|uniref:Stage 0 sporulation protein A homolog n=1 Tax=Proteinivorax tanatarense TaxID=1260629 RepID=A0AAU7VN18_9FIRM
MKRVLLVDDEKQILRALSRVFLESPYSIYTAESGEEALAILDEQKIDMIVSDMRMPYMNGYQLLNKVKVRHPNIIRLLLSGYSEENTILKALNENVAKTFIFKPWENEQLLLLVDKTFKVYESMENKDIAQFVNNIGTIPVLEGNHKSLLQALEESNNLEKISCIVKKDQAISAKILRIAQSSYYQKRDKTKALKVEEAIEDIGAKNFKMLVDKTSTCDYCHEKHSEYIREIWTQSLISNKLVSRFYKTMMHKQPPSLALVAGALHNIGMLLMFKRYKMEYLSLFAESIKKRKTIEQKEVELFGISHGEIGSYLLDWWEFPHGVVEAAMYHHSPTEKAVVNKKLVHIIHLVNYYTFKLMGIENYSRLDTEVFTKLDVSQRKWEKEFAKIKKERWYDCEQKI